MPAQFPCLSFTGTQSRMAWRAQQQTPQQDTEIRESNSKTGLEHVILHTNHRHKVTVSFLSLGCGITPRCLTCPTPSALASSPAASPPKPIPLHSGQKRNRRPPVQSHAWAHSLFLGGKHKDRQQEIGRKKCKAWICHILLHLFPSPPFYQF